MEGSECAGRREEGSPHRAPPTRGGKVCGVCLQSCSRRATWLPQLLETSPTISQTFSSPRTKDQIPGSQLFVRCPPTPPLRRTGTGARKDTLWPCLCAPPLLQQPREEVPGPWQGPCPLSVAWKGGVGGGEQRRWNPPRCCIMHSRC